MINFVVVSFIVFICFIILVVYLKLYKKPIDKNKKEDRPKERAVTKIFSIGLTRRDEIEDAYKRAIYQSNHPSSYVSPSIRPIETYPISFDPSYGFDEPSKDTNAQECDATDAK